jgi:hypothetical protein
MCANSTTRSSSSHTKEAKGKLWVGLNAPEDVEEPELSCTNRGKYIGRNILENCLITNSNLAFLSLGG